APRHHCAGVPGADRAGAKAGCLHGPAGKPHRNRHQPALAMTALNKRACGPCTVCCTVLKIDTPQLRKPADTPCKHLCATGCGIYEARPPVCQQFLCGWRLFAELGDDWRPDLSGVLVMRKAPAELPPAWQSAAYGVELAITGGEKAVRRPGFAEY